ncbi:MAG: cytochrome c biogenesis protein CcsA [Deltaproteobacteria bacterium]|nr:cytochrome c biogenesis protein CcsA [Deltaproteobacteria bacterium]
MRRWVSIAFECATFATMVGALYAIFLYAPVEKTMGIIQKIFYFHVSAAFLSFFAFFIVFVASILYLHRRDRKWDILAQSSAEIGIIFCTLVLITGPIWAKPIWNVWWTWDPRLTTTLILWFIYVSYLMLRGMAGEGRRESFAAVFGIVGFINVPITFFAIRIWRTIHPVVIRSSGLSITSPMLNTMIITLLAFTLLYFYLLMARIRLERMRDDYGEMRALWEEWNNR